MKGSRWGARSCLASPRQVRGGGRGVPHPPPSRPSRDVIRGRCTEASGPGEMRHPPPKHGVLLSTGVTERAESDVKRRAPLPAAAPRPPARPPVPRPRRARALTQPSSRGPATIQSIQSTASRARGPCGPRGRARVDRDEHRDHARNMVSRDQAPSARPGSSSRQGAGMCSASDEYLLECSTQSQKRERSSDFVRYSYYKSAYRRYRATASSSNLPIADAFD